MIKKIKRMDDYSLTKISIGIKKCPEKIYDSQYLRQVW